MIHRITTRVVRGLRADPSRRVHLWDDALPGFGVVVLPSGRRSFVLRYGPERWRRQIKVGDFGPLTVDQARDRARKLLTEIAGGADPLAEKAQRRTMPTFSEFRGEYIDEIKSRLKSWTDIDRLLGKCPPAWNRLQLDEITAAMVQRRFDELAKEMPIGRNRWRAALSGMLAGAWRRNLVPENVARKVRSVPEHAGRTRVLDDAEMGRLLVVVEALKPHDGALLRILIETGCRISEALAMRWADLDLEHGVWRLPNTKAGRPQAQPLPAALVELLAHLPPKGLYVIPGRSGGQRQYPRVLWRKVCERAEIEGVHVHDLRRSAGLYWARAYGLHIASRMLRHANPTVTAAHYAPLGIDLLKDAAESRSVKLLAFKMA